MGRKPHYREIKGDVAELKRDVSLSKDYVYKLLLDPARVKRLLNAILQGTSFSHKVLLSLQWHAKDMRLYYATKNLNYDFPKMREKLEKFLLSGDWFVILYSVSPAFRLLTLLGLPEEDLLETFVFLFNLPKKERAQFFMVYLFKLWQSLRKEESIIERLIQHASKKHGQ